MADLPAGSPDPRDALYWANNAALEFSRNQLKAKTTGEREGTEAKYKYNSGQLRRALPQRLTANRNQANNQGLAESGQLAQTQGRTQTDFAGREGRLAEGRRQAINEYTNKDLTAEGKYNADAYKNLMEGTERSRQYLLENPPQAPAAANGGVVNKEVNNPNGTSVRIGAPRAVPRVASIKAQPTTGGRVGAIAKVKKRAYL